MELPQGHLSYCTNIHPGEDWPGHFAALKQNFPSIKRQVSPETLMGIGLRLSNAASLELAERDALEEFKHWLRANDAYVFYDGPPFITGVPHHGTLLSSIVKDAVPRYWTMKGKRVERVWGWDCHGLPIEQKVARELQAQKKSVSTAELRELCDQFSEGWIAKQTNNSNALVF